MNEIITQIVVMSLLMGVGVLCAKTGIINDERSKGLSEIAMKISTPAVIVASFQRVYTPENARGLFYSFLLALVCIFIAGAVGYILVRRRDRDKDKQIIERFSVIYSNCAFIGIPLVNGVYGEEGIFYLTAFFALFNLFVWSHGVIMMKGEKSLKSLLHALKAPAFISVFVGLALFLLQIDLPYIIDSSLQFVGGLVTPIGMMVAGATIAKTKLVKGRVTLRIHFLVLLRLIVTPVITILVFALFPYDEMQMGVCLIAAACPSATICTMFAVAYCKDSVYSAQIFAISTIWSMVTLPLMMNLFLVFNIWIR